MTFRFGTASSTGASNLPKIIHKTNTSVQGERVAKCAVEQDQSLPKYLPHCALFVIHFRRTHSLQCYTSLNQFSLQLISPNYNSTVIGPPSVCIPSNPVWSKAFLFTEAMLPQHVAHNTVTVHISLSHWHYSRLHIDWCIVEKMFHTLTVQRKHSSNVVHNWR